MNVKNKLKDTPYGLDIVLDNGHKPPTLWFASTKLRNTALSQYRANKVIKAFKYIDPPRG